MSFSFFIFYHQTSFQCIGKLGSYYADLMVSQAREMKAVATAPETASAVAPEHVQVAIAP